jgi:hypothetical protein
MYEFWYFHVLYEAVIAVSLSIHEKLQRATQGAHGVPDKFERTALSISGAVRGTAFSAVASRPNNNPKTAIEKRIWMTIECGGS